MSENNESVFRTSLRALFKTFFVMVGISAGVILLILCINLLSSDKKEIKQEYELEILPNAKGIRKDMGSSVPVILQLNMDGIIGTMQLDQQTIRQQLLESREGTLKNDRVKAIFVYMNSMGGTVIDSDGIYQALQEYKKQYDVPIYTYVDGFCASGGYLAACASDKILASNSSLIGSVGVRLMYPFFNLTQILEKFDIPVKTFAKGKDKDSLNPFRPWKADEGEGLEEIMTYYYDDFVNTVLTNRTAISRENLVNVYGAQLFPSELSLENGYIDVNHISWRDALQQLLDELGISDDQYQVVQMKKEKWFQQLWNASEMPTNGEIHHTIALQGDVGTQLHSPLVYLYDPHG